MTRALIFISPSPSPKPFRRPGSPCIPDRSRTAEPFPCRESVSPEGRFSRRSTNPWARAARALSAPPHRLNSAPRPVFRWPWPENGHKRHALMLASQLPDTASDGRAVLRADGCTAEPPRAVQGWSAWSGIRTEKLRPAAECEAIVATASVLAVWMRCQI
jgi:hypothetical protein